ncbi:MAG: LutC/YkgG family protein [Candidatus Binataceae bacterium]
MADLQAIVARVKDALASGAAPANHSAPASAAPAAIVANGNRAELVSSFGRELQAVGGRMIGPVAPGEVAGHIVEIARERSAKLVAVGQGIASDMDAIAQALQASGITAVRTGRVDSATRAAMREQLAHADAGVAEADYAIASTGTLAVLSDEGRPSALTLLPPNSIVVVRIDRMVPDLAAAMAAFGPAALEAHRMTLITGPSRTADIEKRIVMGVHGPKSLDVIVVWPRDD